MQITAILKLLDIIHDYLLCPIFGDDQKNVDYSQILNKLDIIQKQIEDLKNGKHNK